jgi:FAD synthetase
VFFSLLCFTGTVLVHLLAAVLYARHAIGEQTRAKADGGSGMNCPSKERSEATSSSDASNARLTSLYPPIRSVYITAPYPFEALDTFVDISAQRYNLNLVRFGGGMKIALERFLDGDVGKGVKAVLVGTRRGDPHGGESLFMVESMW